MNTEFNAATPDIFKQPGLEWFRYAETRRDGSTALAGNMSDDPRVLNEANHALIQPDMSFEDWVTIEKQATDGRITALSNLLGVSKIGRVRPAHDTNFINLDTDMDKTSTLTPVTDRPFVDATALTTPGSASMIAPADCIVATVVYPSERVVAQIHAGIRGLPRHIIPQVLQQLAETGADPREALVYVGPHAQGGFQMNAQEEKEIEEIANRGGDPLKQELHSFLRDGEQGLPVMDLTQYAVEQLTKAGIQSDHIQISPKDTLTDPQLFSDLNQRHKGANGRFGIIAGIAKD